MQKVLTVARTEFLNAIHSKAFIVSMLLIPLMFGGSVAFQSAVSKRGDVGDRRFAIIDHTRKLYPVIAAAAIAWNAREQAAQDEPRPTYLPEEAAPAADARQLEQQRLALSARVERNELFAFVEIPETAIDERSKAPIRYYSNHPGYVGLPVWVETVVNQAVLAQRLRDANADLMLLRTLQMKVPIENFGLLYQGNNGQIVEASRIDRFRTFLLPAVLAALMMIIIISSATPLFNSVLEEKMTRVSEVLLGSVTPFQLMMGKLLGTVAVSVVLGIAYLGGSLLVARYYHYAGVLTPVMAAWFAVYLLLAVLLYGSVFIAIGSAVTDIKDGQGLMTPVMLLFALPFFVWRPILEAPEGVLATSMSLVPIATPTLMILRLSMPPGPPLWQVIASLAITSLTTVAVVWMAGRIFRVGVLMQGKSATFAEMLRWVRA
jgi:ABC-2 type transport system permease protein